MIRPYFISAEARRDIDEAYEWYESMEAGRGDEFLVEFHDALREVREHPEICYPVSRRARAAQLPRSKYIIYFREEIVGIVVFGVRHSASDDKVWKGRM